MLHHQQQQYGIQQQGAAPPQAYAIQSSLAGFSSPAGTYGLHSRHQAAGPTFADAPPQGAFDANSATASGVDDDATGKQRHNDDHDLDNYNPYSKLPAGDKLPGRRSPSPSRTRVDKSMPWWLSTPWHRRRVVAFLFLVLGFATRFYMIQHPHQVVFDEVHFGGFASHYMRRTYFFDVHPPTGKLMIALAGYLAGYDGSFTFKDIGMDYLKAPGYVVARRVGW